MKGRSLSLLGILAAVIGAVLLICYRYINSGNVTLTAGIIFMAVGVFNLIFNSAVAKSGNAITRVFTLIANAASIVLGLSMLIFQSTFSPMITFIFSLLVAIAALWQFFVLAIGTRPHQLPAWLYIFPVLIAAAAVYMFTIMPKGDDVKLMVATGISMALLAVGCLIEGSCLGIARRNHEKAAMHQTEPEATDVTATEDPALEQHDTEPEDSTAKPAHSRIETTDDLDDEIKEGNYE